MMRKLLLGLLIISANSILASHTVGGQLTYEHDHDTFYTLKLYVVHDSKSPVPANPSVPVCITNPCAPVSSFQVTLDSVSVAGTPYSNGGVYLPGADLCVSDSSAVRYYIYYYENTVDLGPYCANITMEWEAECCRTHVDNLASISGTNNLITARLNNTLGPNSLPEYSIIELMRPICRNRVTYYDAFINEPDGDSLYFYKSPVYTGQCGIGQPMDFNAGYSVSDPVLSYDGYHLNNSTGVIDFSPIASEKRSSVGIVIEEYRFHPITRQPVLIGSFITDFVHHIVDYCSNEAEHWGFDKDTLVISCGDSIIPITFTKPVVHTTIDPTDFRLIGPNSVAVPVIDVSTTSSKVYSDRAYLKLFNPLLDSGVFALTIKTGMDGNSLTNVCGSDISDSILYIHINGRCNIGLQESTTLHDFKLYPNPASGLLTLSGIQKGSEIAIMDLRGSVLASYRHDFEKSTPHVLHIDKLQEGIYIVKVTGPYGQSSLQKLVKSSSLIQ
ncbi:MAG TPA: hypothetical protein DDW81_04540 [Cryomorphaceae bacterium]|nr:hypothetical protein [Owenweeksia sp.]HBF19342.1 hypothetical protein [Cryomorphaceae bacterium]HCQ17224.1 hypothetical protein [Cryomorphaceae bacterium]|tara:strand:- start:671 stop:2167 length:1497 start_codon:yes stop_codon:yes gene_type:complete